MAAITDQSTSELRANLRARREWAQTAIGWRRRDALREIREIEDELETRGEPLEPEPPERPNAPQPEGYYTSQRLKMHTVNTPPDDDPQLCYHEDRGNGLPLCGQRLTPWTDENGILQEVEWATHGPGLVDCGKCLNNPNRDDRSVPLAEPQGDSVRAVSGGAFEMNRSRH